MESKKCSKCDIEKELSEFFNDKRGKYGKCSTCKICTRDKKKIEYQKNREKYLIRSKENFKKKYIKKEITIDDLTGRKFGRLTVLEMVSRIPKKGVLWKCQCDCGNTKNIYRKNLTHNGKTTQSCGCLVKEKLSNLMTGDNHYNWKGGKPSVNGNGYLEFRYGKLRGVREHRYIYEQHYGIKLKPNQNIHHINGDRLDNRIENLELWDTSQPSGQRVEDKIRFYFDFVKGYQSHPLYKDIIEECKI